MPNKSHWRNKSLDFFKDPQAPIILRLQAYLEIKKFSGSWLNITAKDLGITELDLNIELLKEARQMFHANVLLHLDEGSSWGVRFAHLRIIYN